MSTSPQTWRDRPFVARLGRFGAMALLLIAPSVILLFRHASPVLALLLLYFLTVPLFWSSITWPPFVAALRDAARNRDIWIGAGFAAFCLISATVSPAGGEALVAAAQMAGGFALIVVLTVAARYWPDQRLALYMVLGVIVGALLLLYDLKTGMTLRPVAGVSMRASDANRAAVYCAIATPLLLHLMLHGGRLRLLALVALPLAGYASYVSHSSSAKLAFVVAIAVYFIVHVVGRRAVLALGASICVSVLFMPLFAGSIHGIAPGSLYDLSTKNSMEARAIIWDGFARLTALKPILGFGFEASAVADRLPEARILTGQARDLIGAGHPHNMPLQIWFELGAIGVLWVVIMIWRGFRRFAAETSPRMPMLAALACAVYSVSIVSHGAWQVWWPLMIGIIVTALPHRANAE